MKKNFFVLLLLGATFLHSCRETEMNTDGDMEETDTDVGNKNEKSSKKHLAFFEAAGENDLV